MGILIALSIIIVWAAHLLYVLTSVDLNPLKIIFWIHLFFQTWIFTGLFITAHDSMHGTVASNKKLNYFIGFLVTLLYAGMWYPVLNKKHKLHHLYPGTADDPDYKTGKQGFFGWWFSFMKAYITVWQILIMAGLFNIGLIFFDEPRLLIFWVLPAVLSTFQLFYFGTYIPHRLPHDADLMPHNSRTQNKNHLWALLSCFFFGYHQEHHVSPSTPWWRLYVLKNQKRLVNR